MAWFRVVGPEPPDEFVMNHWESEGFTVESIVGPCPTIDRKSGKPGGGVFVVYLHRSIIAPNLKKPGWPINRPGPQAATDSGEDPDRKRRLN